MQETQDRELVRELEQLLDESEVQLNLSPPQLYEESIRRREGGLAEHGSLVVATGEHTGRSPNDRFLVQRTAASGDEIGWGAVNRPIAAQHFDRLLVKARSYLSGQTLYVFDGYAGADRRYRLPLRVINERPWHNLFARNMFLPIPENEREERFEPEFVVVHAPGLEADPETDGTESPTFVLLDLDRGLVLIGGTEYAGEIKKSIFTVMNYRLPLQGVLSMHCSANYGRGRDDVALFFGLSGTGKTTLSADPKRTLIGDDEHGWSDAGIFNIEGGCYAKVIRLSAEGEPMIYAATRRFGTILENVVYDPSTRVLDLDSDALTENTRASYPLDFLDHVDVGGVAGHPRQIVFLTCDAFGVLPPISRLTRAQAMYHFLSGYTAKVAGTERGVTEPSATFSTCFGAPFMPLRPGNYARMLGDRLERHGTSVWLVNTGWTGGPYGVGERISLADTRRLVDAILSGELERVEMTVDPTFGLHSPIRVEGVAPSVLSPRGTWSDPPQYDAQAARLAEMFRDNFESFRADVADEVAAAGPELR